MDVFLFWLCFLSITSLSLRCSASHCVLFVDCSQSSSIVEYIFLSYRQLFAEISWSLHERISDSVRWIVLFLSCSEMLLSDWSACYHPEHGRRRSFTHSWSRNNKRAVRGTCRDEAGVGDWEHPVHGRNRTGAVGWGGGRLVSMLLPESKQTAADETVCWLVDQYKIHQQQFWESLLSFALFSLGSHRTTIWRLTIEQTNWTDV